MRTAVFGLGKVGIPIACIFAELGEVIGADVNPEVVEKINRGVSPLLDEELVPQLIKKYVNDGRMKATTDLDYAAKNSDIKIIIVPLIVDEEKKPDFSAVISVSEVIGRNLKGGDVVITATTMPVGSTRNIVGKILEEKSGLKMGVDFDIIHAPERTMNPHAIQDLTKKYPQIVGGVSEKSGEVGRKIYKKINKNDVIVVKNCETAELIKIAEGTYRDANIALANEIAKFCERFGIDFLEVMQQANTQPYCHIHKASIGVGGHCIPVYPHFLINDMEELELIKQSRKVNETMPQHSIDIIKKMFGSLKGKKIAVLGLAFRGGVKEDRFSPTYDVVNLLKEEGAEVFIHDPLFSKEELEEKTGAKYIDLNELKFSDGVIIATNHEEYRKLDFGGKVKFVFDGTAFLDPEKVSRYGVKYLAVGRTVF
jgi:nucleotide sugar dehydrogenase